MRRFTFIEDDEQELFIIHIDDTFAFTDKEEALDFMAAAVREGSLDVAKSNPESTLTVIDGGKKDTVP